MPHIVTVNTTNWFQLVPAIRSTHNSPSVTHPVLTAARKDTTTFQCINNTVVLCVHTDYSKNNSERVMNTVWVFKDSQLIKKNS